MRGPLDSGGLDLTGLVAWLLRRDLAGRLLRALLVAAIGGAAALLLAPGSSARWLPTRDALGTPAPMTIKAVRDYEIVDEEATARRRAEASLAQRAVYDLDEGAAEEAAARIHAAYSLMREEEEALRAASGRREPATAELARVYAAQRDAFVSRLQLLVRDVDLQALGEDRFREETEQELAALAARGLEGMVVADLQLLQAERGRGIVVRVLRGGEGGTGERTLLDLSLVRDLADARGEVERAAAARLRGRPAALRAALTRVAQGLLAPTLAHNQAETTRRRAEAAAGAKPVLVAVKRGEKIIGDGERIEPRHMVVFDGIRAQDRTSGGGGARLGGGALIALAVAVLWRFARRELRLRLARRDALLLAALLLATLGLGFLGVTVADALHERFGAGARPAFHYLIPFAAGAMLARQVLAAEAALLFALASGVVAGLLAGQSAAFAIHATITAVAAAGLGGATRDRAGLFRAGLQVGLVGGALALAVGLLGSRPLPDVALGAGAALFSGAVILPVVVLGSLPVVEGAFGYLTDVRLLELANLNHPALKELIVHAPGTYHHSIVMGAMVEAAAQAIGANPLLARVGAYYHDLGKIRNPPWFAENQRGENRHDALAPSMSALVIKRHVGDGVELAQHWRLPRAIADIVQQHHGTRFVGYFWAMAQRAPEASGARAEAIDETVFRYPGPRPQSREAALVMIADSCEASARAMEAPTPEDFGALVTRRVNEIFGEGQLDDCELTLKDLSAITAAMVRALEAVYHTRPDYPFGETSETELPRPPIQLVARK